jgi:hypothetical protein
MPLSTRNLMSFYLYDWDQDGLLGKSDLFRIMCLSKEHPCMALDLAVLLATPEYSYSYPDTLTVNF